MKKKLVVLLFLSILLFTSGCGNATIQKREEISKIEIIDTENGFYTSFNDNKKLGFSKVETYDQGAKVSIEFDSIDLDVDFAMSYMNLETVSYKETQKNNSNKNYYKEFTFGKYKAYAYGDSSDSVTMNILLNNNKETNISNILVVTMNRLDTDEKVNIAEVLEEKELQEFFQTISFKQIIEE